MKHCAGCGFSTCLDCCTLTREQLITFHAESNAKISSYAKTIYSLVETLQDIVSRFPSTEILNAITPKSAESVRLCSMVLPTVAEVLQWRRQAEGEEK
jgi:hypothetical protein